MNELAHIVRCLDLREEDVVAAIAERETTRALLAHLASCSKPNTGAAKALLVLARMATTACAWLDGDLAIELIAIGDRTRVDLVTDLGGGLRERVFPTFVFRAPMSEFARAVERVPHMIAPLVPVGRRAGKLVLGATAVIRKTSIPPPPIEISAESLFVPATQPASPASLATLDEELPSQEVDDGWDE